MASVESANSGDMSVAQLLAGEGGKEEEVSEKESEAA